MLSAARRRAAVLAVLPVLGLAAAGCAEVREQTQVWRNPVDGVSANAGDLAIRNALVVADADGDSATVLASFANAGIEGDGLVAVTVDGVRAEPAGGTVEIPARGFASAGPASNRVDVDGFGVTPGMTTTVEFIFASAPRASVQVVVQADDGLYAGSFD